MGWFSSKSSKSKEEGKGNGSAAVGTTSVEMKAAPPSSSTTATAATPSPAASPTIIVARGTLEREHEPSGSKNISSTLVNKDATNISASDSALAIAKAHAAAKASSSSNAFQFDDKNPAIGGRRPTTPSKTKTEEEKAIDKDQRRRAKIEEERIRTEKERRRKLLAGTGVAEIGTRISEMLYVDFVADNVNLRPIISLTNSTNLASMGEMALYKGWLRGALSVLSVFSFIFSMINIQFSDTGPSHYINAVICLSGIYCVFLVYKIKAKLAGISNPLYGNNSGSILHSPHLFHMLLEMASWGFTPPYILNAQNSWWLSTFDFMSFFRLANIAMWFANRRYSNSTFCRAMNALSGVKLTTGFYIRTSMIYEKVQTSIGGIAIVWGALALAFSHSEGRTYWDSLYFTFITAATIGYGDISPVTVVGRISAFFAWLFGLLILGWVVAIFQMHLNLSDHEKNLYILFRTNDLSARIRDESARLIQSAFRIHMRNKLTKRHTLLTDIALWRMARLTAHLKKLRHEFRGHTYAYSQVMAMAAASASQSDQYKSSSTQDDFESVGVRSFASTAHGPLSPLITTTQSAPVIDNNIYLINQPHAAAGFTSAASVASFASQGSPKGKGHFPISASVNGGLLSSSSNFHEYASITRHYQQRKSASSYHARRPSDAGSLANASMMSRNQSFGTNLDGLGSPLHRTGGGGRQLTSNTFDNNGSMHFASGHNNNQSITSAVAPATTSKNNQQQSNITAGNTTGLPPSSALLPIPNVTSTAEIHPVATSSALTSPPPTATLTNVNLNRNEALLAQIGELQQNPLTLLTDPPTTLLKSHQALLGADAASTPRTPVTTTAWPTTTIGSQQQQQTSATRSTSTTTDNTAIVNSFSTELAPLPSSTTSREPPASLPAGHTASLNNSPPLPHSTHFSPSSSAIGYGMIIDGNNNRGGGGGLDNNDDEADPDISAVFGTTANPAQCEGALASLRTNEVDDIPIDRSPCMRPAALMLGATAPHMDDVATNLLLDTPNETNADGGKEKSGLSAVRSANNDDEDEEGLSAVRVFGVTATAASTSVSRTNSPRADPATTTTLMLPPRESVQPPTNTLAQTAPNNNNNYAVVTGDTSASNAAAAVPLIARQRDTIRQLTALVQSVLAMQQSTAQRVESLERSLQTLRAHEHQQQQQHQTTSNDNSKNNNNNNSGGGSGSSSGGERGQGSGAAGGGGECGGVVNNDSSRSATLSGASASMTPPAKKLQGFRVSFVGLDEIPETPSLNNHAVPLGNLKQQTATTPSSAASSTPPLHLQPLPPQQQQQRASPSSPLPLWSGAHNNQQRQLIDDGDGDTQNSNYITNADGDDGGVLPTESLSPKQSNNDDGDGDRVSTPSSSSSPSVGGENENDRGVIVANVISNEQSEDSSQNRIGERRDTET